MYETLLTDEAETLNFGAQLAQSSQPPLTLFLHGELGAGKTTLVRGFMRGLGYTSRVKSPTYNLVELYEIARKAIFHFDLYRLEDEKELDFIGFSDYWQQAALFLIEWPEKGGSRLPQPDISLHLELQGEGRKVKVQASTESGQAALLKLVELRGE